MTGETDVATAIDAAAHLAAVIEAENQVLAVSDFRRSAELAEAKRAAIARMADVLGRSTGFPAGQRNRLAAVQTRLDAAVRTNRDLLRSAIETQQRVIRTVVQALDDQAGTGEMSRRYRTDQPVKPVALVLRA